MSDSPPDGAKAVAVARAGGPSSFMRRRHALDRTLRLVVNAGRNPSETLSTLSAQGDEKKHARTLRCVERVHEVHQILSGFPIQSLRTLSESINAMQCMGNPGMKKDDWERVRLVFGMEALMSLHEIARDSVLRMVRQVDAQLHHFHDRVRNPLWDIISNGISYCEEAPFSPLQAGIGSWMSAVLFVRRVNLRRYIRKLQTIRKRLVQDAALLHCKLHEMQQLDSFQMNGPKQLWSFSEALCKQLEGAETVREFGRGDPLVALVHLVEESLCEFENRVAEYMDMWELHPPSYISQHWPGYAAAAGCVAAVAQSSWMMSNVRGSFELGSFMIWDCLLVPALSHLVSSGSSFLRISQGGDIRTATHSSLKDNRKRLSVLLKDYEEKYTPETKALMSNSADLNVSGDMKSDVEYKCFIHSLLVQIQRLRVDLDTSMLELIRLVEANRFTFGLMVMIPVGLLVGAGTYMFRWALKGQKFRKEAATRLCRRLRSVESLLINAPDHAFETAGLRRTDLQRLGEILFLLDAMDEDRLILGGEIAFALETPIAQVRGLGLDVDSKLRVLEQIHRVNALLMMREFG